MLTMSIDLSVLSDPLIALTVAAIVAVAVSLTLAVKRTLTNPARQAAFDQALDYIQASELDLDTALNPNAAKRRRSWFDYWAEETVKSGKIVKDPAAPGRTALGIVAFAAVIGLLVFPGGLLGLIALPLVGLVGYRGWLRSASTKRIATMEKQLPMLLTGMRANLQAGATAQVAVMSVADDLPSPLGDELRILKRDLNVATSLEQALTDLSERVPSREMQFLISSIRTAIRSGADLDPQIEEIQGIVAQRTRIRQKLRSAVSQVKPTKWLAYAAVPGMFAFSLSNVDNRTFWFGGGSGMFLLVVAAVLYAAGGFIIRTMVKSVENN